MYTRIKRLRDLRKKKIHVQNLNTTYQNADSVQHTRYIHLMIHKLAFDSHDTFSKQAYLIVHIIALCAKILFNLITFQLIGFRIGKNIFSKN